MNRIFHPWDKWEDYKHNFYGGVATYDTDYVLERCAGLLRDLPAFEAALKTITTEWKYSCEHNLSNNALNRVAYLGQASFALLFKIPQAKSMTAYNLLTEIEKSNADALAQRYLNLWLENNSGN